MTSNGNSHREAGSIQLRRRLHSGFTANLQYTFAKAIDDDAVLGGAGCFCEHQSGGFQRTEPIGGAELAGSERGAGSFDFRSTASCECHPPVHYRHGNGGWNAAERLEGNAVQRVDVHDHHLGRQWASAHTLVPAAEEGTGVMGALRPDYTGASVYAAPPGLSLNPAAYTAPLPGQYGNAGRDPSLGPSQFTLNASAGRTFRLSDRLSGDLADRFHQPHQPRHLPQLEHHVRQCAVRPSGHSQCHAKYDDRIHREVLSS